MSGLSGKQGLVVGVANKRSIAWAIAKAADRAGARLILTYATERFEENVRELAKTLEHPPIILPCDVSQDDQITEVFSTAEREFGGLDFFVHAVAFASRASISEPFVQTLREDFRVSLDISVYSLIALSRGVAPLMETRGGGSILTLTYLGGSRVFPHYNVMGVAKAALEATVRYLSNDLGPKNIRVNAISAGPVKTLSASGISGFTQILQHYRERAPLHRTVESSEIAEAAIFLLSPAGQAVTADVLFVDAGFHSTGM